MDFILTTRDDVGLNYLPSVPSSLARYKIPGAREVYGAGEFGAVLFYEQAGIDLSVWSKSYIIKQTTFLNATPPQSLFQLYFAVSRGMRYLQKGLGKIVFPEGQFNILY